jgi:hypothetical protein
MDKAEGLIPSKLTNYGVNTFIDFGWFFISV